MPTNKQRRDANRVRLQRQLEARRESEARRRKVTLITSIAVTVVLIAAIVITIVAVTGGKDTPAGGTNPSGTASTTDCTKPATGQPVTFDGVTVTNPTQAGCKPKATSTSTTDPTKLMAKDLIVGKGKAASPTSSVEVQYVGLLYKKGTQFEASWDSGGPVPFSLTGVVPGFTQGIGGTTGLAPMKVGGRRIVILPSALAYGTKGNGTIAPNTALVFIIDLTNVTS